jgi:hypothetical protein
MPAAEAQLLSPPRGALGPETGTATDGGPGDRSGGLEARLEPWRRWWDFNQAPYLARLRSPGALPVTAAPLDGTTGPRNPVRPAPAVTYAEVVPALVELLGSTRDVDVRAASLLALAKIGAPPPAIARAAGIPPLGDLLLPHLTDANERVRDLAVLSLGISGDPGHAALLAAIAANERAGREAIRGGKVDLRTRAFATHALGLIGASTHRKAARTLVEHHLVSLASDHADSGDLLTAAAIALGWCPLPLLPPDGEGAPVPGGRERTVRVLLELLERRKVDARGRAQVPVAVARLLAAPLEEQPEGTLEYARSRQRSLRTEVLLRFTEALQGRRADKVAVQREGYAQALGLLVADTGSPADQGAMRALLEVAEHGQESEALCALVALGRLCGGASTDRGQTARDLRRFLTRIAMEGSTTRQASALLALGVAADRGRAAGHDPALGTRSYLVRRAGGGSPSQSTAAAVAVGLAAEEPGPASPQEDPPLREGEELRGGLGRGAFIDRGARALAVAMLGDEVGLQAIKAELRRPLYRPYLTRDFATALSLARDPEVVPILVERLVAANFIPERLAAIKAFEWCGDPAAAEPLIHMLTARRLAGRKIDDTSRALAASALGNLCARQPLPWNTRIALDVVWNAAPPSLTDARNGGGVLDVL